MRRAILVFAFLGPIAAPGGEGAERPSPSTRELERIKRWRA